MKKYSVYEIADWFLSKEAIQPYKIMGLVYYFYAWGNALYATPLIHDTQFIATFGRFPAFSKELYKKYQSYGAEHIPQTEIDEKSYEPDTLSLLESVWTTYKDLSGNELHAFVISEEPYKKAFAKVYDIAHTSCEIIYGEVIQDSDMKDYYTKIYEPQRTEQEQ